MAEMTKDAYSEADNLDAELAEVLLVISLISKQLAEKITAKRLSKEAKNGKKLRTDRRDDQSTV
ncbi:hypothetical protein MOB1_28900 [Faecalimonas mobilis]